MNLLKKSITGVLLAAAMGSSVAANAACSNPVEKLSRIINCIDVENAFCAASGYDTWRFRKFHNGVDTNTNNFLLTTIGWLTTFNFIGFEFDIERMEENEDGTVDFDYYEYVRFPDGEIITQYEKAVVHFNNRCRMTLWDQTGDQAEQDAVDEKTKELFPWFN
ncbi:hypothetical protein [Pleionea sediminis]|uniref:hypothetical protein n=1 Tax=Pleionea sediminis TaxID=2569479 RepID=UPI001184BD68|nr:hypothetical protein [Pleionea sediminis]